MTSRWKATVLCFFVLASHSSVSATDAPAQSSAAQALRLSKIDVTGAQRYAVSDVIRVSGLQMGQKVTPADLDAVASRMGATGLFTRVGYRYTTAADHIDVIFDVIEAKWTVPVIFDNFVWFTDAELTAAVKAEVPSFDGTAPESGGVTTLIQQALTHALETRNIQAQVDYVPYQELGGKKPEHVFSVKGVAMKTCALRFDGASAAIERELQAASASLVGMNYSRHYIGGYSRSTLIRIYRQHGYWRASTGDPVPAPGAPGCAGVSVTIPFQEGEPYKWERADWRANTALTSAQLDSLLGMKSGDIADLVKIESGLIRITNAHGKVGYVLQKAAMEPVLDDSTHRATFQITLDEGPQFRMGRLVVLGLAPKDAESLRNRWKLKPGDVYDASYLDGFYAREVTPLKGSFKTVMPEAKIDAPSQTVNVTIVFK